VAASDGRVRRRERATSESARPRLGPLPRYERISEPSKGSNQGIPKPIVDLITATQNLTGELIKSPFGEDWRKAVADLREITLDIKKTTHSTQNVLTTQSLPLSSKIRSYAQAAAGAPPPAHTVSSHGSSSPGATPSELSKDREVIVKLPDAGAVKTFRRLRAVEIKNRTEKARVKASKTAVAVTLATVQFVAARQLKSGDLSLSLRSAQEAEIARCHPSWASALHKGAVVRLPTWGVVVHDVQVKSIGNLKDPQEAKRVADQILAENIFAWGDTAQIVHLTWLTSKPTKKSSALVIEFSTPQAANKAINTGTIWDSMILTTVLYDRSARIRRCFNCQQYGHIGSICSNITTCGLCAGSHETRDCPQRATTTGQEPRKCANCGDAHAAWSKGCRKYAEEVDKVQAASCHRQRYHRIPPYLQDFRMDSESSGSDSTAVQSATPVDSSQQSEGSGGSHTARKETPRSSKGPRKARSEPSQQPFQAAQRVDNIDFAPAAKSKSTTTNTSKGSRRSTRLIDQLNTHVNPPSQTDEMERPVKALRNDRTAAARGTRLHIYQDHYEEDDSSDELSEPITISDWQPSVLQDKDTNTNSSTQARKNKRKRGIEGLVQNGLQQMEIDPQIDFAVQSQTPQFTGGRRKSIRNNLQRPPNA
jgi:hypothetical protein